MVASFIKNNDCKVEIRDVLIEKKRFILEEIEVKKLTKDYGHEHSIYVTKNSDEETRAMDNEKFKTL